MKKRKFPTNHWEEIRISRMIKRGFTLIELVCVVALLAILVVVAIPAYDHLQDTSAEKVALANARTNYSIGKANDAIRLLDPDADTEPYLGELEEDSWDSKNDKAGWKGKINGKEYTVYYEGNHANVPYER